MLTKRPRTIGYTAPYFSDTFFREVYAGVREAARQHGARIIVLQASLQDALACGIATDHIDGWVVVAGSEGSADLAASGIPVITISHRVQGAAAVIPDNASGMAALTRHLIALGHRQFAFIGELDSADIRERLDGLRTTLAEAGIAFDERLQANAPSLSGLAGPAVEALLASGLPFTALVAGDDDTAFELMNTLRAAGRRVPEDIAVTGFDDIPDAADCIPPLTTVRQNFEELGRAAASLLFEQLDGAVPPEMLRLPTDLIVRSSCGTGGSEQDARVPAPDLGEPGGEWDRLARRLVEIVRYPAPVPPEVAPEQIWPGVQTLVTLLKATLDGKPELTDAAIRAAWAGLIDRMPDGTVLGSILELLSATAERHLAARAVDQATHSRAAAALTRLRDRLLASCLGIVAKQFHKYEKLSRNVHEVTRALTTATDSEMMSLDWLHKTDISWACLGLWDGKTPPAIITAGALPRGSVADGQRIKPQAFPPLDSLPPEASIIELVSIQTSRQDWGYIALAQPFGAEMSIVNASHRWIELLGLRLDDHAVREQLEQERHAISVAYERERVLANTVRELGCPIIPLGQGALLVPLIGSIDSRRAAQVIETVLAAVSEQRTIQVLLDVSGVPVIDTHVAGVLLQLAQMVALLGARVALIGVRPEIAQSIVSLGVNLRSIAAYAALEHALRDA